MLLINGERVYTGSGESVLTGDAIAGEVLTPKTFYSNDPNTKLTGTMPDSTGDVLPSAAGTTIPAGYHNGTGKTTPDADLIAANIKSGVTLFGILGTFKRPLSSIGAITGTPYVGDVITAGAVLPVGATYTLQWKRADTVGGVYSDIVGQTATTYTVVAGDEAKFIKVEATGTGVYEGTALSAAVEAVSPFTFTIDTTKAGSAADTIVLPLVNGVAYNFTIDWGQGAPVAYNSSSLNSITKTYTAGGVYQCKIRGTFPRMYFNGGGDRLKFMSVQAFGKVGWTSMDSAFNGCANLTLSATDGRHFSAVTSMSGMFIACTSLNHSVSSFDTANVTDMSSMFNSCTIFNQSLANFNTAKVTNMSGMFFSIGSSTFNGDLTNFNTALVTDMTNMFRGCSMFNKSLASFNTAKVTNMTNMFLGCAAFNQSLSSFNTALVIGMSNMFSGCTAFNQSLASFNTAKVTSMNGMFLGCAAFNQSLSSFDTALVTNMANMFNGCTIFNQSVSSFNTANVTTMEGMFGNTAAFNQSLANFNTAKVTTFLNFLFGGGGAFNQSVSNFNTGLCTSFRNMFRGCSTFNQDLSAWNIANTTDAAAMLDGTAFANTNYNLLLVAWQAQVEKPNVPFSAGTAKYSAGAPATARAALVTSGWTITDGGAL